MRNDPVDGIVDKLCLLFLGEGLKRHYEELQLLVLPGQDGLLRGRQGSDWEQVMVCPRPMLPDLVRRFKALAGIDAAQSTSTHSGTIDIQAPDGVLEIQMTVRPLGPGVEDVIFHLPTDPTAAA